MTSETNGTDCNKTTRICQKPVVVELNGNHIEATHHIVNDDAGLLHLYIGGRSDGIDVTVPLCSDKPPYARSDRGARALGLNDGVEVGDVVTVRDEDRSGDPGPWKVKKIEGGEAVLWSSMQPMRYEPVEDLTVVEEAEDTTLPHSVPGHDDGEDDDGPVVMTDGGRVTCVTCGTPIDDGHMPDGSTIKWCTDCRDDCKRDECDKQEHPALPLDGYCSPWCATEDARSDPALDHYDSTGWV